MSLRVNVADGTNAGRRRPPAAPANEWAHLCRDANGATSGMPVTVILSGRFANCPACYTRRPS